MKVAVHGGGSSRWFTASNETYLSTTKSSGIFFSFSPIGSVVPLLLPVAAAANFDSLQPISNANRILTHAYEGSLGPSARVFI